MDRLRKEYKDWFTELKAKIRSAQAKAAITINSALICFYWELGKMISETQTAYGTGFLDQVSKDLRSEFPEMKGLSYRNLALCRQFLPVLSHSVKSATACCRFQKYRFRQ